MPDLFRKLSSLLLIVATIGARAECDFGSAHPEAPAELQQFAFLIGEHDVKLHAPQGESWSPPRPAGARWNGRWALAGMAIEDEWFDPGPESLTGTWGVNLRMFDGDAGQWKMTWIARPAHQVQDLRAEVRDGVLTMWQLYPERPDWKAEFRVLDEARWDRVSWTREGAEAPWQRQFRLVATRRACTD